MRRRRTFLSLAFLQGLHLSFASSVKSTSNVLGRLMSATPDVGAQPCIVRLGLQREGAQIHIHAAHAAQHPSASSKTNCLLLNCFLLFMRTPPNGGRRSACAGVGRNCTSHDTYRTWPTVHQLVWNPRGPTTVSVVLSGCTMFCGECEQG